MLKDNVLIRKLLEFNFPTDDYAIFASGPLLAHGLKDSIHDLDIVARGEAWKMACGLGTLQKAVMGDNLVLLAEGDIEIFDNWSPGEWNVNEIIDTADTFEGIKFARLEDVLKWKKLMGREKDKEHIKLIEEYLTIKK